MITTINTVILITIAALVISLFKANSTIGRLAIIIAIKIKGSLLFTIINQMFLGFSYLIVYVGAISILFIFAIKLVINKLAHQFSSRSVNIVESEANQLLFIVLGILLFSLFRIYQVYELFDKEWSMLMSGLNDIQYLAISLFEVHWLIKILLGILLFGVLVGILKIVKTKPLGL